MNRAVANNGNEVVIIDRYLLDFIVDESVNYGNIENSFVTRYFLRRLNKIDFTFYIDVSEEVALKRKSDIPSIAYLQERRKYYKQYISKLDRGFVINNEGDISIALSEITTILNSKK